MNESLRVNSSDVSVAEVKRIAEGIVNGEIVDYAIVANINGSVNYTFSSPSVLSLVGAIALMQNNILQQVPKREA